MKQALDAYEELKDASEYVLDNWLRLPPSKHLTCQLGNLNGAACFLFDRLFAKEDAAIEISALVKDDLMEEFDPQALGEEAAELALRIKQADYNKDTGHFAEYFRFISQTEEYVLDADKDDEGKLTLAYLEKLVNLIIEENKEQPALKVGEIVFLNMTSAWRLIYKGLYGPRFNSLKSAGFFEQVDEACCRIRGEINE